MQVHEVCYLAVLSAKSCYAISQVPWELSAVECLIAGLASSEELPQLAELPQRTELSEAAVAAALARAQAAAARDPAVDAVTGIAVLLERFSRSADPSVYLRVSTTADTPAECAAKPAVNAATGVAI